MRSLIIAKVLAIASFTALLGLTYFIRSEVITLNTIRLSSDALRAEEAQARRGESQADRISRYQAALEHYEVQRAHYRDMLELYRSDYEGYVRRLTDEFVPPPLPSQPSRPMSPELEDRLANIKRDFLGHRTAYFTKSATMNGAACLAALLLCGSLLFLLFFDPAGHTLRYLGVLGLSFVFMIGPSFHSFMSAVVGFLNAPGVY